MKCLARTWQRRSRKVADLHVRSSDALSKTTEEVFVIESAVLRARFGSRVRSLLAHAGQSTADLAVSTKLETGRIEKILEGSFVPITLRDMEIIAQVLGTPLYKLLAPPEP